MERKGNTDKSEKAGSKDGSSEEEITLDFSKITGLFKGKKHKEHKPQHRHVKDTDSGSEEEISFDFNKTFGFFNKNKAVLITVLLLLIPIFFSIFARMETSTMPITKDWAKNSVDNYIQNQIIADINSKYPNLPDTNKQSLISKQFTEFVDSNKAEYTNQINQLSAQYKSYFEYESGGKSYLYMPDIDPYVFLRQTRNLLDHGYVGDKKDADGDQIDDHMLAPLGINMGQGFMVSGLHPYFLAFQHKLMSFFNPNLDLMQTAMYFPVILCALSIIPAFFIGRRIGGNVGGFFTAMMIAINAAAATRTLFGHADTDAYNLFFPLLIVWSFLEGYENKSILKGSLWAALGGLAVGVYSKVWVWWYVFDFILAAVLIYTAYYLFANRKELFKDIKHLFMNPALKTTIIISIIFIFSSAIFVSLFNQSVTSFTSGVMGPLGFISIKEASHENLWPNVYTTVAELNAANIQQIVSSVGGGLFFFIALLGIILIVTKKDIHGKLDIKYAALLTIWFLATIYASFKGVRFTLLLVPAFAVAFGVCLGMIYRYLSKWIHKEIYIDERVTKAILIVLFCLLFIKPIIAINSQAKNDISIVDDAWYNSLTKIKDNSQKDAIINSWWDFGHHFKYIADRAVTFDGASQNTPQAHWIGKALLTDDSQLATGILRMLDCGANNAFDVVDSLQNDTEKSVDIIYNVIQKDETRAKSYLALLGYEENNISQILRYTHCNPPEDFFITSDDMIGKAGVWAHFGSWDFNKAKMWVRTKGMNKEEAIQFIKNDFKGELNYSDTLAEQVYYTIKSLSSEKEANDWIAPWPSYMSGLQECSFVDKENTTLKCGQNAQFNFTNNEGIIATQQGVKSFRSVSYFRDGKFSVIDYKDNTAEVSAAFVPTSKGYSILLMQPQLVASMFTRLYFFDGAGLDHFEKFDEQRHLDGGKVIVWKVKW